MNHFIINKHSLSALALACMLTACGGGSSSSPTPAPAPTPTPAPAPAPAPAPTQGTTMTLSGIVTDSPIADANVQVKIGSQTFETTSNSSGEYSVEVAFTDEAHLVQIQATGAASNGQEHVELISIAGTAGALFEEAGDDQILTSAENMNLNATHLSTAKYLLAKDLNNEQAFTSIDQFNASIEQVNTADLLQIAGAIKLIVDNPDYASWGENNLLTTFDGDSTATMNALSSLIETTELDQTVFDADIEAAIAQTFSDRNVVQGFTNEMIEGKSVLQLLSNRPGYLTNKAQTVTYFADQNTAVITGLYSPEAQSTTYSIENGKLVFDYQSVTAENYRYSGDTFFEENFDAEVNNAINEAGRLGWLGDGQIQIEQGATGQEVSLLSIQNDIAKVRVTTNFYSRLNFDDAVIAQFPVLANPESTTVHTRDVVWYLSVENLLAADFDFQGKWALPLPTTLSAQAREGYTASSSYVDAVILNEDGSTTSTYADEALTWSVEQGKLTLTYGENQLRYTPFMQSAKLWLTKVDLYQNGDYVSSFASPMARFDDSASEFSDNLVTELPEAYLSYINAHIPEQWDGDKLHLDEVFGYHFEPDGNLKRGIANDYGSEAFYANTTWKWNVEGTQVHLNQPFEVTEFRKRERIWHVISVDEDGRALVLESENWTEDANADGVLDEAPKVWLSPRINILLKEDLSKWKTAWDNRLF